MSSLVVMVINKHKGTAISHHAPGLTESSEVCKCKMLSECLTHEVAVFEFSDSSKMEVVTNTNSLTSKINDFIDVEHISVIIVIKIS